MARKPKPTMTPSEAKDFESRSLNRARGGTNKPAGKPTLTPSERGGFETKSLKQSRVNPKATPKVTPKTSGVPATTGSKPPMMGKPPSPPNASGGFKPPVPRGGTSVVPRVGSASRVEKVVQGTAEFVRNKALPQTAKQVAKKGLGRIAATAFGPVAGAVGAGLLLGDVLRTAFPESTEAASNKLTDYMASKTGLERIQNQIVSGNGALRAPMPRKTAVAPGGTSPVVPPKTVSEAPKPSTPKDSTSPASKKAPKPSQKATGASKGQGRAMKGAELANFLGLSADSAVRTYMETGKHKYPSKKK